MWCLYEIHGGCGGFIQIIFQDLIQEQIWACPDFATVLQNALFVPPASSEAHLVNTERQINIRF